MTTAFQPIAIIGIGCRLPGRCNDPDRFWQLLESGRQAISLTPSDRWNLEKFYRPGHARPGKTQSKWGGYIDQIDRFDPQLFGISPREAASMDPQQRLLLETAYRAAEDAGVPLESLAGQSVSVHIGISSIDYAVASLSFQDRGFIGPYNNTGVSSSIAANRISYCFDLRGESVAVDTACSSSLIATHLACQTLQDPSTKMAFAGGVNALLLPDFYVAFSQLGVLSPDGRCKTFDASANGYVRSEGAGMVLLKRLDDAVADGDSIYAVIRGSATNQDGRTEGLTVPNQAAQETLIRTALASAGLDARDVSYVEAHGTGTPVGDPIEANAIANSYRATPGDACHIGSVKTNIGHLEAGAGIASVIKVALAIKHAKIPAHLNFESPHPEIPFESNALKVPLCTTVWETDSQRLAGINGFGYGGANAHLILGEPPSMLDPPAGKSFARVEPNQSQTVLLPISAHDPAAIAKTAARWADWLEQTESSADEIAAAAARKRTHHDWRAAIVGNDRSDWIEGLRRLADEPETFAAKTRLRPSRLDSTERPKIAFICSGQGPQWWAMGRGLLQSSDTFAEVIERCDRVFSESVAWSLVQELSRDEATSRLQETAIAQPSLFALQIGLAALWRSKGITPSVVVGHSVGEIAAAYLSGGLSFRDACHVAIHRGRTMDAATSKGAMIAVGLSVDEAQRWIADCRDRVSIAAINGPTSLTVSGCEIAIADLRRRFNEAGIFCRPLGVEYAFHSPQMDPVRQQLLPSLAGIRPRGTQTPMVSTVTGGVIAGTELDEHYWWRNVRESVRFADAMDVLSGQGIELAIELGPHPVLNYAITECFSEHNQPILVVPSLSRNQADDRQMTESIGRLYQWGYPIDWELNSPPVSGSVKLPPLAMNTQSLWLESRESKTTRLATRGNALLGDRLDGPDVAFETRIDLRLQDSLADHCVRDTCVLPAAAMLELSKLAATSVGERETVSIRRFRLQAACLLQEDSPIRLRTHYDSDRRQITIARSGVDDTDWQSLAIAEMSDAPTTEPVAAASLDAIRQRLPEVVGATRLYEHCQDLGLNYGERFRGVRDAIRGPGEAILSIDLTDRIADPTDQDEFGWTAALWDSCFHGMIVADPDFGDRSRGLYLPQQIGSIDVFEKASGELTAHVRILWKDDFRMIADMDVFNDQHQHCLAIRGFESVPIAGKKPQESIDDLLYRFVWKPAQKGIARPDVETSRKWLVFTDQSGTAAQIANRFPVTDQVITVQHGTGFKRLDTDSFIIDPEVREQFDRLLIDLGDNVTDVVYLWGLDAPENVELSSVALSKSTVLTTTALMNFVSAWQSASEANHQTSIARFGIVTRNGQPLDDKLIPISLAFGPLIGFGRVIASECGRLKTKLIDLATEDRLPRDELLDELISHCDDEDEVMIRDSIRWVRRFGRAVEQPLHDESSLKLPCVLRRGEAASIDQLRYETLPGPAPSDDQVEIEVVAAGLNFSDVMKSLDLYPGLPDGPVAMGAECSGRIRRVGSRVKEFEVGDEVIAVAPGSFATHVLVNAQLVAKKPSVLTHCEAATIPIAFLTAQYALNECARIRSGERVLIHAASGGVGIAATQLAVLAGAQVFATAGTEEKRDFVRRSGGNTVMDSRSLDFARQTLEATHGEGVDVVLNSLPGEAITRGLSILRTGGRFLEIGKRDIYADLPLGLETLKNNLALFAIDLDQLFREQPERMGRMLRELVQRFSSGELTPLPVTQFSADETPDAFRFIQQAKQIGKVALDYRGGVKDVFAGPSEPVQLKPDRTYWIAGGLGGFGLRVAQWMIERGAKHLVLGGRSQTVPRECQSVLDAWARSGTQVHFMPVDLTSIQSVRSVAARIDRDCPPLAGVFHTAMILEDRLLGDLDEPTLQRVLRPKVLGGWNLHAATEQHDLDLFVLFSSLSSVFGHAGQANYAAANAFLDSLAHYRRSIGMPATAINWGHVGGVGYLARRVELSQRLERQGVLAFTPDEAMQCLDRMLQTDAIQQSVLRMDWTRWRGLGISGNVSPRFAHLLRSGGDAFSGTNRLATAAEVRAASPATRQAMIAHLVGSKASTLLGIDANELPWDRPLLSLGLDSLMAVEMRNWIESRLQIDFPIAELMRSDGLQEVCHCISQILGTDATEPNVPEPNGFEPNVPEPNGFEPNAPEPNGFERNTFDPNTDSAENLLGQLPDMTDTQVDSLLAKLLEQTDSERTRE